MQEQQSWDRETPEGDRRGPIRLGVLIAVLFAIAIVVWMVTSGGDDNSTSNEARAPEAAQPTAIAELAESRGDPVYWAGEQGDITLELSETEGGRVYVRYLTGDAQPGDARAEFLTVGTYEFAQPIPALERLANQFRGVKRKAPNGGIVYFTRDKPTNVYLAYPGEDVQIEVYHPDPKVAKDLVTSGQIVPVK